MAEHDLLSTTFVQVLEKVLMRVELQKQVGALTLIDS